MQSILKSLTDNDIFLQSYLDKKHRIVVTFVTIEYYEMVLNWWKWVERSNLTSLALICCLDKVVYLKLQERNLPCIYIDEQETYKNFDSIYESNFYKLPRHICIVLAVQYIIKKYNVDIIYTDADMIILKDFMDKVQQYLNKGADTLLYTNKTYSELTTGVKYGESSSDGGGMLLYWNNKIIDMFIEGIKNSSDINADSPKNKSISDFNKLFKFDVVPLNTFEFTNIDIWRNDHMRNVVKNISYIVHYNMFDDVTKLSHSQINSMIAKKIKCMRQYDHWIL